MNLQKPSPGEYALYYMAYIERVPDDGRVLEHLKENLGSTMDFVRSFPIDKLGSPHEPGEWTIKEILVHLIDSERIFAYRALRFARGDKTALAGFNQDTYVPASGANEREIENILAEYASVRTASLTFFESLREEDFSRLGAASGNPMSVSAAAWIIAGHELHHMKSIRENYG